MKKILILLLLGLFSVCLFARDIVVEGYGDTAEQAKNNASVNLSKYVYGEYVTSLTSAAINDLGNGLEKSSYSDSVSIANEGEMMGVVYSDAVSVGNGKYKVTATISDTLSNIYIDRIWNAAKSIDAIYALSPSTLDSVKARLLNLLAEIKKYDSYKQVALLLGVDFSSIRDYSSPITYQSVYVELQSLLIEEGTALNEAAIGTNTYNSSLYDALNNSKSSSEISPEISGVFYSSDSREITITSPTSGVSIYYTTDGTEPDINGNLYIRPFTAKGGITVKAKACRGGYWSEASSYYVNTSVNKPTLTGAYHSNDAKEISVSSTEDGASIYYTLDGSEPDVFSFEYQGPFTASDGSTVKVKAFKDGYWSETVIEVIPTRISAPEIIEYKYKNIWEITIECQEKGAKIYYTTDGSDPDLNDKEYRNSFDISKSCQIKARAYKDGYWSEIVSSDLYFIGEKGPAGGWIFYDVDADNEKGNKDGLISSSCGWRYLEAAPLVLRVVDGVATVNYPINTYFDSTISFVFGYYRGDEIKGLTNSGIGYGESNTKVLIATMGEVAYKREEGYSTTSDYAALLCYNLEYNGFNDWFLPSIDELDLLISNVGSKVEGHDENNHVLWSSTSVSNMTAISKFLVLSWNDRTLNRSVEGQVVPCRTF